MKGKCRAIGVSNYTISHLEELLTFCEVVPHVNQVELHPFLTQQPLRDFCKSKGILVQSYSTLGQGKVFSCNLSLISKLLEESAIVELAKEKKVSPSQVLLRWAIQNNLRKNTFD